MYWTAKRVSFPLLLLPGHLSSECGIKTFSHVDHFTIPPCELWQVKFHLILLSSFWEAVRFFYINLNFSHHFGTHTNNWIISVSD